MRPAEWLQEVWMKRFREVYGGWRERRLSQEEAARILGVSDRTFYSHTSGLHYLHQKTQVRITAGAR